jgi:hypothetical protein
MIESPDAGPIIDKAIRHSDMCRASLTRLASAFYTAHNNARGGPSLEIGTRRGGSAMLMLYLLDKLYQYPHPILFTIDPYGGKPYNGGDLIANGLYGDGDYLSAKSNLAQWSNHAHFLLTGIDFLDRLNFVPYWRGGMMLPIDKFTFALLDGDHDAKTIGCEVERLTGGMMRPGGLILIDNVDKDPKARDVLGQHEYFPGQVAGEAQAVIYA